MKAITKLCLYSTFLSLSSHSMAWIPGDITEDDLTKFEVWQEGEKKDRAALSKELRRKMDRDYGAMSPSKIEEQADQTGHNHKYLRDAHPKAMLCASGMMSIFDRLQIEKVNDLKLEKAPEFAKDFLLEGLASGGLWKYPGSYPATVRFSSSANVKSDFKPDAHGMAIKVNLQDIDLDTEDFWLLDEEQSPFAQQDLIMINDPVFPVNNVGEFLSLSRIVTSPGINEMIGSFVRFFMPSVNPLTWRAGHLLKFVSQTTKPVKSHLSETFFSMTPYLWNGQPVKFSALPCQRFPEDVPPRGTQEKNILRRLMNDRMTTQDTCFYIRVQPINPDLILDSESNRNRYIESSLKPWSERDWPFYIIGKIDFPVVEDDRLVSEEALASCDQQSYNPWHSFKEMRPLGSINRARATIYQDIFEKRAKENNFPESNGSDE